MRRNTPYPKARNVNAHGLTPDEMEFLHLIIAGYSNGEIAEKRKIKVKSVDMRIRAIECTLNPEMDKRWSRDEVIAYAREHIFKEVG